jgi:hypothetical protein
MIDDRQRIKTIGYGIVREGKDSNGVVGKKQIMIDTRDGNRGRTGAPTNIHFNERHTKRPTRLPIPISKLPNTRIEHHIYELLAFHHLPIFSPAYLKLLIGPAVTSPLTLCLVAGLLMIAAISACIVSLRSGAAPIFCQNTFSSRVGDDEGDAGAGSGKSA